MHHIPRVYYRVLFLIQDTEVQEPYYLHLGIQQQ